MGGSSSCSCTTYGDITKVSTTGASRKTAEADGQDEIGVAASEAMARHDSKSMKQYRSMIYDVGREYDIDPALIAAIISRESRAGTTLDNGWGDWSESRQAYNGFGLMQIDVNPKGGGHKPRGKWDSEEHLEHGTEILVHFIKRIREKFPDWCTEQKLKGGIAAYNMGDGKVHSYNKVDENTTGKDYSNDVVARAKWYKKNGFECRCN